MFTTIFSSNLNSVCCRIWNSILVLGFGTALICELLEIPKSRTRRGSAATKLQARSEFTQIYKAAKRRVAQGHRQKKFPRVERTTSHKEKTICAKLVPIR